MSKGNWGMSQRYQVRMVSSKSSEEGAPRESGDAAERLLESQERIPRNSGFSRVKEDRLEKWGWLIWDGLLPKKKKRIKNEDNSKEVDQDNVISIQIEK